MSGISNFALKTISSHSSLVQPHLYGLAEVVALPLLLDDVLVDLPVLVSRTNFIHFIRTNQD